MFRRFMALGHYLKITVLICCLSIVVQKLADTRTRRRGTTRLMLGTY